MRAGRLRFLMTVEQPIEKKNTTGEVEKQGWTYVKHIWADIEPLRGEERYSGKEERAVVDTKITMRALTARNITPKMRLKYKERVFDIDSNIEWRNRGQFSEIYCKEVA